MPGAGSFSDPGNRPSQKSTPRTQPRLKQTGLPHQLLPCLLPFEEEAFSLGLPNECCLPLSGWLLQCEEPSAHILSPSLYFALQEPSKLQGK